MKERSLILAYAWSIPLAVIAFLSSRDADGNLRLFLVGFALVALGYVLHTLTSSYGVSRHHLGHALVFATVVVLASLVDSRLDGMAGLLYLMMPAATLAIVLVAVVGAWVKKQISGPANETAS